MTPELIKETNEGYARVLPRFADKDGKPRQSWSKKSILARVEEVGLGGFYQSFYVEASGVLHGDIAGLLLQLDKNTLQVDTAPSPAGIKGALMMGHQRVLMVLESLN